MNLRYGPHGVKGGAARGTGEASCGAMQVSRRRVDRRRARCGDVNRASDAHCIRVFTNAT